MRLQNVAVTWAVLAPIVARAEPVPPAFEGQRPLQDAVETWMTDELDQRVCYEGAKHAVGTWRLDVPADADPVAAAVAASNASPFPAQFREMTLAARRVVIAETVQESVSGSWNPAVPLLDTPITFTAGLRQVAGAMQEWEAALEAATGEEVMIANGHFGTSLTDASGTKSAREMLGEILDDQNRNIVWSLYWVDGRQFWVLSIRGVWGLVEKEQPLGFVPPVVDDAHTRRYADGTEEFFPDAGPPAQSPPP